MMVIHRTSNRQQFPVPYHTKKGLSWKMAGKVIGRVLLALLLLLLLLTVFGTAAHAAGLVDDTVDAANEYSKYPLDNYQLDFYVDSGWDWLPWNWLDGIGKQVMYGLYAITNFIWTISLYLSNATGYLIQEAYSLDFISSTADSIGKNMQTLGRRYHRRLVLGGILCRVPADSHSGGGALRCLHRAYQTGNHKSHPCRCEFRGGVRAVRCLYRLCS
jgi:uncharacterized membrane protein